MQISEVTILDQTSHDTARQIHAVQFAAYRQEAELLGAKHFPPLLRSVSDIQHCPDHYLGVYVGDTLAGVASVERTASAAAPQIASLTVAPAFQRRGIARALLAALLTAETNDAMVVSTGIRNLPALKLYRELGFVEVSYRQVGPEALDIVELRWVRNLGTPS
jgi:GNAT superfamily N-acetyltransferase